MGKFLRKAFTLRTILFLVAIWLFMMAGAAFAADFDDWADRWSISELKVGFLKHDVDHLVDITTHRKEDGLDLNGEILFDSPHFLHFIGSPRPNIGGSLNTHGDTSHGYVGLQWELATRWGLFADVNGGFSVHTGLLDNFKLDDNHETDKRLGTRVLFHFAPEIGWRFHNRYSVSLYWEHLSNGQVLGSDTNEGLDNVGIRFGYKIQAADNP